MSYQEAKDTILDSNLDTTAQLLTSDPTLCSQVDEEGKSLLFWASNSEVAKILLEKGSDINLQSNQGYTPLYDAVKNMKTTSLVQFFIENNADMNLTDGHEVSVVNFSCENGLDEHTKCLFESGKVDFSKKDMFGRVPLHWVCQRGNLDLLNYILEHDNLLDINLQTKSGDTALIWACEKGNTEIIKKLLSSEADPRIENEKKENCLHYVKNDEIRGIF